MASSYSYLIFETFAFSVGNARLSVPDVTTHM